MTHLLVRAPNWVGDLVMSTPVLDAALNASKFDKVTILLRSHLAPLLADGPLAQHVLQLPKGADEVALMRGVGADAALLLSNSFGCAWRARRAGIRVRAGAALAARGFLLTHRVHPPRRWGRRAPIPTQHLHVAVAGLLGIEVAGLKPRLHVSEALDAKVSEDLERAGVPSGAGFVFCAPSAAFGAAKLWPPEHFARALDDLHDEYGLIGVVGGGPGEEQQMRSVVEACRHPVVSLEDSQRDLHTLKAVIKRASLVLVGDSGPRWVAAAYAVPCVTVMGPNYPQLTASSMELCRVVRREDLSCSPCAKRTCPLGHHACMQGLEVERVTAAARVLLSGTAMKRPQVFPC